MDWTPIVVAIISGVVSSFGAILVYIGNEKQRKTKLAETHAEQLKELEKSLTNTLKEHRQEYMDEIGKVSKRIDDIENNITNIQAVYQQNTAVIELKIQTLSDHVEKHNKVIERTYNLEKEVEVLKNRESVSEHRLTDIEKKA